MLKIHSFSGHSSFIVRLFIGITGDHWGTLVDSHLVGGFNPLEKYESVGKDYPIYYVK
jgi:hypothetical protein